MIGSAVGGVLLPQKEKRHLPPGKRRKFSIGMPESAGRVFGQTLP